jgi:hypothetical protein
MSTAAAHRDVSAVIELAGLAQVVQRFHDHAAALVYVPRRIAAGDVALRNTGSVTCKRRFVDELAQLIQNHRRVIQNPFLSNDCWRDDRGSTSWRSLTRSLVASIRGKPKA